jgi:CTP:molybdopterin cytidylyltransferase MocA
MIAAIILSAGASRRMGVPKAQLLYRGRSFLQSIRDAASATGLSPEIAVVGPDAGKYLSEYDLRGATVIENPDLESGPLESTILALEELLNRPVEAAVVWHVDRPHVAVATVQALIDRFHEGGVAIVVPAYEERRGHPVLFGRETWRDILARPAGGLRTVVRADPGRVGVVAVPDPAVLEDIDTPEDYEALIREEDAR